MTRFFNTTFYKKNQFSKHNPDHKIEKMFFYPFNFFGFFVKRIQKIFFPLQNNYCLAEKTKNMLLLPSHLKIKKFTHIQMRIRYEFSKVFNVIFVEPSTKSCKKRVFFTQKLNLYTIFLLFKTDCASFNKISSFKLTLKKNRKNTI